MNTNRLIRLLVNRALMPFLSRSLRTREKEGSRPQDRQNARAAEKSLNQARKALRASRRFGRF